MRSNRSIESSHRGNNSRRKALEKFLPKFDYSFAAADGADKREDIGGGSLANSNFMADQGRDENLYLRLHRKIDEALSYPGVFVEKDISGYVKARIKFDADGKLVGHSLQVDTTSRFLKVYVTRFLQAIFSNPVAELARTKRPIEIECTFSFAITEHNDRSIAELNSFTMGKKLFFYRNAQKSNLQWKVGPLRGMFPIPAVQMDLGWFYEMWQEHVNGKRPLDAYQDAG